jgi:aspartyl-tRNA(Asn)/glutamyl-tRNA(Gln) amidotransferase subunit C
MKITKETVFHIAELSCLNLTEEEIEKYQKDLSAIINYIDKLNQADTAAVVTAGHVRPVPQNLREDGLKGSVPREEMIRNAPSEGDGFFKVPKFI